MDECIGELTQRLLLSLSQTISEFIVWFLEMMCRIWNRTAHYIATKKPLSFSISLNTSHEICSIDGEKLMPPLWGIEGVRKGQMLRQAKGLVSYFIHKLSTFSTIYWGYWKSIFSSFQCRFFFYNSSPLVRWIWRHINLALLSVKIRIDAILLILLVETMCMLLLFITVTWR